MSAYVPEVAPMSRKDIEDYADRVNTKYHPGALEQPIPIPVVGFFDYVLYDDYDLETGVADLGDGIEGITYPDGRVYVDARTYEGAVGGNGRARFTIGHEAFHGMRHRKQIRNKLVHSGKLVLHRRNSLPAFRDPEWQANVFAGAFLMPAAMVRLLANDCERDALVDQLMRSFVVSRQAAEVRLKTLMI
jgi:IrrE N-terminal-like domain